ncbi:MAG: TonB-dependent receptor domain-containing protein [Prevotella sp.]
MTRKLILYVGLFLCCLGVNAENKWTLTGRVLAKSDQTPLEFATVSLLRSDSTLADGATTDSLGCFTLKGISSGTYILRYSYVGLSDLFAKVDVKSDQSLGDIYLDDSHSQQLNEVVVAGHKPTFSQHLDRKVYIASNDIMATSGSISDLLQHVPTLDVDIDGNVSLRGNSNVMILVDGRPSAQMNSKNRGDILQQMSASQIEKIEVITNPSAEYKPDGVSGVVNIITKKNVKPGLNGSVSANVGSKGRYNAGVNVNYHTGRWNFLGAFSYKKDRYDRMTQDDRTYSDHVIHQNQYGLGHPTSYQTNLGFGVNITNQDRFEAQGGYNRRHFLRSEDIHSNDDSNDGNRLSTYHRTRSADATENNWNGSLHYSHTYGEENRIDVDYAYNSLAEDEGNDYHTITQTDSTSTDLLENQHVWDAMYLNTASARWEHHFGKNWVLKAGYELEAERRVQRFHLSNFDGTSYVPDAAHSSDFANKRIIHSLYTTLQFTLHQWEFLAGLRGEYVTQRSHLYTLDSLTRQHYCNVYPTLHASWHMNKQHTLMLSYSLRVQRPDGDWLNPFAESINPLSLRSGNPDLEPEKTHSFEVGWQWETEAGTNLMATLYERYTINEIVWTSHNLDNGQLLSRPENAKSHNAAGVEIVWSHPVSRWLNFNCNLNGFYSQITQTTQGSGGNHNSWSWSMLVNANLTPWKNFTLQLNTRYRSRRALSQGYRKGDFRMNLGAKYDIPKWKLSFIASVTDLFDTYKRSQELDTGDMKQRVEMRRNPRIIYVGAVWNFGLQKKKNNEIKYDEGL